jgi:hypothetical protein
MSLFVLLRNWGLRVSVMVFNATFNNISVILILYCHICIKEEFEDTKGAIRIRISKKQTTQWPKEKVQKDKQRSIKHTYKTKDRVTRTPLKPGMNSGAPEG